MDVKPAERLAPLAAGFPVDFIPLRENDMSNRRLGLAPAAWVALLLLPAPVRSDVLVLNDDRRVGGEMLDMGDAYQVATAAGVVTVRKSDISRIIRDPAELAVEGDLCRQLAQGMYDTGVAAEDPGQKTRDIGSALELFLKALSIYRDARRFFPGSEHAGLDAKVAETEKQVRACREKLPQDKAAEAPPEPAPAPSPAPPPVPPPAPPKPPDPPPVVAKPDPPPAPIPPRDVPPPAPAPRAPPVFPEPNLSTSAGRLMADIRKKSREEKADEVFSMCNRLLRTFPDAPEAAEAQWLVGTLPHPDGRLVCGFDQPDDLKAWRLHGIAKSRLVFSLTRDDREIKEGWASCHLTFPPDPPDSTAAILLDLPGFDGAAFKGLSVWLFQPSPSPGELEIAFVRPGAKELAWVRKPGSARPLDQCLYARIPLKFTGWRKVTLPAADFKPRGGPIDWKDAGTLVLYDARRDGVGVVIDGLRFQD